MKSSVTFNIVMLTYSVSNTFTWLILWSCSFVTGYSDEVLQIFPSLPIAVLKSTNTVCRDQSDMYVDNLKNLTLWAHEMWDATSKSNTGVLRGNIYQMGHFDQCLSARAPFPTQYCLATISASIPKPQKHRDIVSLYFDPYESIFTRLYDYKDKSQQSRNTVNIGWCTPSSCSIRDLEENLNEYLLKIDTKLKRHNVTYRAKFTEDLCHTNEQHFDGADICFCFLLLSLITIVILATIYDYIKSSEMKRDCVKKPHSSTFIMTFSAQRNFLELNKAEDSNSSLNILYGMRVICIVAIIIDHRFGTFISSAVLNFNYVEMQYRSSIACLFFNGDLFVDSFFILSGLLIAYTLLNQMEKYRLNPGFIILLRYVRLTPVYAFVVFYYATMFYHTGEGPLWKIIAGGDSKDCRQNWWTNLLYINNYVNEDHMCMTHSWYLPCDFHYFIIAIFVVIAMKKNKKIGISVLVFLTALSLAIPFALTMIYQRPGLMHFYPEFLTGPKVYVDFQLTYSKSHTRATPYFVGMFAGYLYYHLKGTTRHICRVKSLVIIAASVLCMLVCVFTASVFYDPYHNYNALEAASYASFHRLGWGVGTVGILYTTSFGHASFLKTILSLKVWIPLSKLVYGAYLCHMSFQLRSAASFMVPRQLTYFDVMSLALSDIVLAFVTSLGLYLLVEAPFRKIFKKIMMPSKEKLLKNKNSPAHLRPTLEENMIMNNNNVEDSRL